MKRIYLLVIIGLSILSAPSCIKEDKLIPIGNISFVDIVSSSFTEAIVSCTASGEVTVSSLFIEYADNDAFKDCRKEQMNKEGEQYTTTLEGLSIQTTYYYRYIAVNKVSEYQDKASRSFKTSDYVVPEVVTCEATSVSGTTATLNGEVTFSCGKDIIEQGFMVGENENEMKEYKSSLQEFSFVVNQLKYDTKYYYRAYAKSEIGKGEGETKSFTTCKSLSFNPLLITDVTATSASLTGGVADSGGVEIEGQGFRYKENNSTDIITVNADSKTVIATLKPDTEYSVWCYAKTSDSEYDGEPNSFKTLDGKILINTLSPESVTKNSAKLKGSVSSDGGSTISERGFCYSTSADPTTSNNKIVVIGSVGDFEYPLWNLPQNTTYYVRAYAINGIGTFYGENISFTTLYDAVQFGKMSCSDVTASSVSVACSITSNGGSTVTKCGFCYSTSKNPTTDDGVYVVSGSTSSLVGTIKNLNSGTTYYVRAFATNANSTFYSEELSLTTVDGIIQFTAPVVSNIAAESAIVTCSVISAGGGIISERGFCYGITKNPTIADNVAKTSGTVGEYSLTISGLKNKTVYYFRAYATNESGTYYSQEVSATTLDGVATLSTTATTEIMAQSATLNGIITSDGGSNITERGFCYSTSSNPTTSSTKIIIDGTTGTVSRSVTGLNPATKYYVRVYAVNGYGTHYGAQESFTTSDGVVSFSASSTADITVSSFKVSATISSDGNSAITKRGFCYSTSQNPTIQSNTVEVSGTVGQLSSTVSGLTNNVTYYVRPFAVNAIGTYYGTQISVKTLSGIAEVTTSEVTGIKAQAVTFNGEVLSANGSSITERGFCYSTSVNPTTASKKVIMSGAIGTMSKEVTGLNKNTTYYVKAYASTPLGTAYGNQQAFTTKDGIVTFSGLDSSNIKADSATVEATIQNDGGALIIERGICFSTSETPSVNDSKISASLSGSSYSVYLPDLNRNTIYYYRAYAQNNVGTYYSNIKSFKTCDGIATLGSLSALNIKQTSVEVSCNITADGGSSIIERGFCYSLSSAPTITSSKQVVSGSLGNMSATLTSLYSNSDYYIRAYVKTKYETTYSNEVKIHTIEGLASLSSTSVDNITTTTATLHAILVSQGGSTVNNLGFCYSTHENPTLSDNSAQVSIAMGNYSSMISGLEQYTKYYCRPYATTEYGTNYGPEISFMTSFDPIEFGNLSISCGPTSAHVTCSVLSKGGLPILDEGVCINESGNPSADDKHVNSKLFDNSYIYGIGELSPNKTYYVRHYIRNRAGVFYGTTASFTTLSAPDGTIQGVFSVSESEKVFFSKGNLILENNEWRFASHQYDVLKYYPGFAFNVSSDTHARDLFDPADDWKNTQQIQGGGSNMSIWHVIFDWSYLLHGRAHAGKLRFWVNISNVGGLMILPDCWVTPQNIALPSVDYSTIPETDWAILEANGAVFIPYVEKVMQWWGPTAGAGYTKCYSINTWGGWGNLGKQGYYSIGSSYSIVVNGKRCSIFDLSKLQVESVYCYNQPSGSQNNSNITYIRAIRLVQSCK